MNDPFQFCAVAVHSLVERFRGLEASLYSSTSQINVKKMQLLQNFAGRIFLCLRQYDHISEGLKSVGWFSIAVKLLLNDSVMVHKCLSGRLPDSLSQTFTRRLAHHDRNT